MMIHATPSPAAAPEGTDQMLSKLSANRGRWAALSPASKLDFLDRMLSRLQAIDHEEWGKNGACHLGYNPALPTGAAQAASEGMVNAAILCGTIRALQRSYSSLVKLGRLPMLSHRTHNEQSIVKVFPVDGADRMSPEGMMGYTGEVWLSPGRRPSEAGLPKHDGRVCLVLGAGNQSFLAFGDVMNQLFVEGAVCVLKHHPLRAFSAPYFDALFADLIAEGFFWACEGGIDTAQELIHSPLVDHVHMTGGTRTHDAIVWGSDPVEQARRKAARTPILDKPMSSELGCITPWLVVPGASWSARELEHMAGHLVAAFTAQASCNCLAPKLLVLDADWPQREAFCDQIRQILAKMPLHPPHYPGAAQRYEGFLAAYPNERLEAIDTGPDPGSSAHGLGDSLPWLLVHIDADSSPHALQHEAFAPVLAIYTLPAKNQPKRFLESAVEFVNEEVWGTLSCTLIAHPSLESGPTSPLEQAITQLRYGTIGVNTWTATGYAMSGTTWGAFPGEPLENVASGIGVVRNPHLLRGVEKTVVRAPFKNNAQLIIRPDGRPLVTARQLRAVREMVLRPSLKTVLKMSYHMVFSGHSAHP